MNRVIITSEYYNAIYVDNELWKQAKPDYLDAETLANIYEDASYYGIPYDLEEELLDGDGYPQKLWDFPLDRCDRYR